MGNCCRRPQRIHARLVSALYAQSDHGELPEDAMSNLEKHLLAYPTKLERVAAMLKKRALADLQARRYRFVRLDQLCLRGPCLLTDGEYVWFRGSAMCLLPSLR